MVQSYPQKPNKKPIKTEHKKYYIKIKVLMVPVKLFVNYS